MALTRISSAGIQTSPTFSGDVKIGLGATLESTGNAYVTGITTLGIGATGEVYLYNPSNSALSGTQNSVYGWKAKTYCQGLQVNSTLYLSRSGSNGLSLTYNNATGSYITANSGFLRVGVPYGGDSFYYGNNLYFKDRLQTKTFAHFQKVSGTEYNTHLYGGDSAIKLSTTNEGILVSGGATVTGNLSVGGTVTYEDVTNVDSIGIVTARLGVVIPNSNRKIAIGPSSNLELMHSSTHGSQINTGDGGDIRFRQNSSTRARVYSSGFEVVGKVLVDSTLEHRGDSDTSIGFSAADTIDLKTAGKNGINIDSGGKVQLYHNNVLKFATSGIGATISSDSADLHLRSSTASATGQGQITFKNVDGNGQPRDVVRIVGATGGSTGGYGELRLQTAFNNTLNTRLTIDKEGKSTFTGNIDVVSTDAGSSAAPEINLFRNSASPADADYLGQLKFTGKQDGGGTVNYAKITGKILDASNGTEDGILEFMLRKGGSNNIAARFRSDSLQLLNGTSLTVAGTTTMSGNLDITGTIDSTVAGADNALTLETTSSGDPKICLNAAGAGGHRIEFLRSSLTLNFTNGSSNRLQINAQGHTLPGINDTYDLGSNTVRWRCTFVDKYVGDADLNVTIGCNAGLGITAASTTACKNIIIGHCAGQRLSTCSNNIFLGSCAGQYAMAPTLTVAIGERAGRNANCIGGTLTAVGAFAGMCNTDGDGNTFIGGHAGRYAKGSSSAYNFYGGYQAGKVALHACSDSPTGGACNIAIGFNAFSQRAGGVNNVILGRFAGAAISTGSNNIAFGNSALVKTVTGGSNFAGGYLTMHENLTGGLNVAIGHAAMRCNVSGGANIGIGYCALAHNTCGNNNIALGECAMRCHDTNGGNNFAAGYSALRESEGAHNQVIGHSAGYCNTTGCYNIAIGHNSGRCNTTGCYNISLGLLAGSCNETASDAISIGQYANYCNKAGANIAIGRKSSFHDDVATNGFNVAIGDCAFMGGTNMGTRKHNVAIGIMAGGVSTAGSGNIYLGCYAGYCNGGGSVNVYMSRKAGYYNKTGHDNVMIGDCAGFGNSDNASNQNCNVFIGKYAGYSNRTDDNIAIGRKAGCNMTTGCRNIVLGPVGNCISTGSCNIAIGGITVMTTGNVTGNANISMGPYSGRRLTSGGYNTFVGSSAGRYVTSGNLNVLIGNAAGYCLQTGCENIAIGCGAGSRQTSGTHNTSLGRSAGYANCTGSGNVAVGHSAGYGVRGANNISIGATAGPSDALTTADDNIFIGRCTGTAVTSGINNIMMGMCAGTNTGIGSENVFIGSCAGLCNTEGRCNVFIGKYAGKCNTVGSYNIAIGDRAGCCLRTGCTGVLIGLGAGMKLCSGNSNIFIGNQTGICATIACENVILGTVAGKALAGGVNNVALGKMSGCKLNNGSHNVLLGNCSGYCLQGNNNVILGMNAGFHRSGTQYHGNTLVGKSSGDNATTLAFDNFDVLIGFGAGYDYTGSCSIGIGHSVNLPINDGQNQLAIGQYNDHWIVGDCNYNVGIGTTKPIAKLDVNVGSSVTAFNIEGSEGQLFSVTNNLSSGSIFAVNDITGLPSVDVNADGTIQLAPRGAGELVGIGTTVPTSKLHLVGDALVTGIVTASRYGADSSCNVAIGHLAGANLTSGTCNILIGFCAGRNNSSAGSNTFIGINAGAVNATGGGNLVIGDNAANSSTFFQNIIAIGCCSATTAFGSNNGNGGLAIGTCAARFATVDVLAIGANAGCQTTGAQNTFVGVNGGIKNTSGCLNTFFGHAAGGANVSGRCNTFLGRGAGGGNCTGDSNVSIGQCSGPQGTNASGCHNFTGGYKSGNSITSSSRNVIIGCGAGTCLSAGGGGNTFIGDQAGHYMGCCNCSTNTGNVFLGQSAGKTIVNSCHAIAIGYQAAHGVPNSKLFASHTINIGCRAGCKMEGGHSVINIGRMTGVSNSGGTFNINIGYQAGYHNLTGANNFYGGYLAGACNKTGGSNIAIGQNTFKCGTSGTTNIFMLNATGCNANGHSNIALGYIAFRCNSSGSHNIALGACAMRGCDTPANGTGCCNIFIGKGSGCYISAGNKNTVIGIQAGYGITTGSCNVILGIDAGHNLTSNTHNVVIGPFANVPSGCSGAMTIGCCTMNWISGFSDGSVTINHGNANANGILRISRSGSGTAQLRFDTASANTASLDISNSDGNELRVRYGSTEHTRFKSDGSFCTGNINTTGIITSTAYVLNGTLAKIKQNTSDGSDNSIIAISGGGDSAVTRGAIALLYGNEMNSANGRLYLAAGNTTTNGYGDIVLNTQGTDRLHVKSSGQVGINSSIPAATLDIHDLGSTGPTLLLRGGSVTEGDIVTPDGEALGFGHWNYGSSTYTERFRINSGGDVGISTSSPRTKLHVSGPIHTDRFFSNPTSLDTSITFPESGGAVNGGVFGPYTINSGVTLTIASGSTFKVL